MTFEYESIEKNIVSFIKNKVKGKNIGISCSGGLDSGLVSCIAKEYADSVTLYVTGSKNAYDVRMAKDLAKQLDLPLVHCTLVKGEMRANIRQMIEIAITPDPFTISYEMPLFCVLREAKEDIILSGQGADEYFMGCAKFVGTTEEEYNILKTASIERLWNVSLPCEQKLAEHFKKSLLYPYLDKSVIQEIQKIDEKKLKPKDMESRKEVLREISIHLGYDFLAKKQKKSSQYGSGTTDLIRGIAKDEGMMYAELISSIRDEVTYGKVPLKRGAVINARIDSIVKEKAEKILLEQGLTPSDVVEATYRKIIDDGKFNS